MSFGNIKSKLDGILVAIILVVVILSVLAGTIGTIATSLTGLSSNLTANGVGFAGFFASGGIIWLILGAVILIGVIGLLFNMFKGGRN